MKTIKGPAIFLAQFAGEISRYCPAARCPRWVIFDRVVAIGMSRHVGYAPASESKARGELPRLHPARVNQALAPH